MAASATPPHSAAVGAGSHRHGAVQPKRALSFHSCWISMPASQAKSVMCKPEILSRCETPVSRKMLQSACTMARWSPISKAAMMPAARAAGFAVGVGSARSVWAAWVACGAAAGVVMGDGGAVVGNRVWYTASRACSRARSRHTRTFSGCACPIFSGVGRLVPART